MQDPYLDSVLKAIASDAADPEGPRLITVDELRAAGALDVPARWRKSLGVVEDQGLFGDIDTLTEEQGETDLDAEVGLHERNGEDALQSCEEEIRGTS